MRAASVLRPQLAAPGDLSPAPSQAIEDMEKEISDATKAHDDFVKTLQVAVLALLHCPCFAPEPGNHFMFCVQCPFVTGKPDC